MSASVMDFAALCEHLAGLKGAAYWRGLEALAATPEAQALIEAEFPGAAPLMDRRRFLQLMAASLAMAGLAACGKTPEHAVAAVRQAPQLTPGVASWYATAIPFCGIAQPVLGKTLAGRPIKLEGNSQHPMSSGTCDAFTQAAILQLYDPDRSQAPRFKGRETSWDEVRGALARQRLMLDAAQGKGLHIVCGASSSPTLARQFEALRQRWPEARFYHAEPFAETEALRTSERVFGQPLQARRYLQNAEVLVCLEDDPLGSGLRQTPCNGVGPSVGGKRRKGRARRCRLSPRVFQP